MTSQTSPQQQYILCSKTNIVVGPFEDFKQAESALESINKIVYFVTQKWTIQKITLPTAENLQWIEENLKRIYA